MFYVKSMVTKKKIPIEVTWRKRYVFQSILIQEKKRNAIEDIYTVIEGQKNHKTSRRKKSQNGNNKPFLTNIILNVNGLNYPPKDIGWLNKYKNKIKLYVVYKKLTLDLKMHRS